MKTGRIVLLFVVAFASIIVPVAGSIVYGIVTYAPPFRIEGPSVTDPDFWKGLKQQVPAIESIEFNDDLIQFDQLLTVVIHFSQNGRVVLSNYPPAADISKRFSLVFEALPTSSAQAILDRYITYRRSDSQQTGVLFYDGSWVILSEAPTKTKRDELLRQLPVLVEQEMSPFIAIFEHHLKMVFGMIGAYCVLLMLVWTRMASWAASIDRQSTTAPIPADSLRARLMGINDQQVPFSISSGKREDELIIEWKYRDVKWMGLMAAGGIKSLARIRLRFDEQTNTVRSQDILTNIRWHGVAPAANLSASLNASWFRGISFYQYDTGFIGGIILQKDGRTTIDNSYSWQFNIQEMKRPLVEIITAAGWDWRPVITFIRLING